MGSETGNDRFNLRNCIEDQEIFDAVRVQLTRIALETENIYAESDILILVERIIKDFRDQVNVNCIVAEIMAQRNRSIQADDQITSTNIVKSIGNN